MTPKPKWHKQVNVNTRRMRALMRDIRADIERRTRNSKDIDEWMEKLSPYIANNCFNTGEWAEAIREIANQIAATIDSTRLPAGSNAELMKGAMAEACMTMVTNVGEDIKIELRKIAVESYNQKNTPQQTAKMIGERIESFSKTRCQCIARTETLRAGNCANYLNAQQDNMKSYTIDCHQEACPYCVELYRTDPDDVNSEPVRFDITDYENLPPYHPNCRCVPLFWPDPVEPESEEVEEVIDDTPSASEEFAKWINYIREGNWRDPETMMNKIDSLGSRKTNKLTQEELISLQHEAMDYYLNER